MTIVYVGRWILRKETLIKGFRIRDVVRETFDMIHQSKETKVSFENSDRPSMKWCMKGHLSYVQDT